MQKRLAVYHAQTEPLIAYYTEWSASGDKRAPRVQRVDGMGSVEEIRERVFAALGR